MTTIPHFSFPFRIGDQGAADTVEQDTFPEIEQNVIVLFSTEVGGRLEVPTFGVPDPTFSVDLETETLVEAARVWDDRASVLAEEGFYERMALNLRIRVEEQ